MRYSVAPRAVSEPASLDSTHNPLKIQHDHPEMAQSLPERPGGTSVPLRFSELPEILTPQNLIEYLPIGRDAIYAALKSQAIRSVRIGQKFIVTKEALREFLGGAVE
jgi:excisionase family DNA binding protein